MKTTKRTPKIFNAQYAPPKQRDFSQYKTLLPLVWIILIIVALYVFFHLPYFSIKTIQIDGAPDFAVSSGLNGLVGESIFSPAVSREVSHLIDTDFTVDTLSCSRGIPNTIRCSVTLRQPTVIWQHDTARYLVDGQGYIFANANGQTNLPVVLDMTAQTFTLGKQVASADIINTYQSLLSGLTQANYQVTNLFVADTLYQVGVVVTGSIDATLNWHPKNPVNFLFATSYPVADQIKIINETIKEKGSQVTTRVDARVPGYVYIK